MYNRIIPCITVSSSMHAASYKCPPDIRSRLLEVTSNLHALLYSSLLLSTFLVSLFQFFLSLSTILSPFFTSLVSFLYAFVSPFSSPFSWSLYRLLFFLFLITCLFFTLSVDFLYLCSILLHPLRLYHSPIHPFHSHSNIFLLNLFITIDQTARRT